VKRIMHEPEDGCGGCPFLAADDDGLPACGAETWRRIWPVLEGLPDTAPEWCPLRAGPVVVEQPQYDPETGAVVK
jgi:hypothetical protein